MTLIMLFLQFFKTGLFSVGGGLATLPFLYEISDTTGWFTHADVADMIAISESTPGAIGINMSTYAGFRTAGIPGGLTATLGLALPSFIVILIVAKFLDRFKGNRYVEAAFYGLRPASIAMISAAGINVVKIALLNIPAFEATHDISQLFIIKALILAVIIFVVRQKFKVHPVLFIAISAVIGVIFKFGGV
ncbi:MAG: chromate transporter [Lachnospiraceae bacterium]|nr:chromate transporter [Lachnospiraceae bacterium]